MQHRSLTLWLVIAFAIAGGTGEARARAGDGLIVKLHGEGPHAVTACAADAFRRGETIAPAAADGSDSLDRIARRMRVRELRPLFREAGATSLVEQRRRLRDRFSKLHAGAGRRTGRAAATAADTATADRASTLAHVYRVELEDGESVDAALALYRADPHVEYVQRDHENVRDALPNDPFLTSSGSWGQQFEDLWALHRIRATDAWEITRGEGVVVAVVDTGLDYEHPDIADNVWVHPGEDLNGNGVVDASDWNGLDDDGNGFVDDLRGFDFANSVDTNQDGDYVDPEDLSDPDPYDDNGHGTHVAGTIAAVDDNGIGIAGVAPGATIMPLKGFPAEGSAEDSTLWRAVLYAAENGAQVINNSWSCRPFCPENPLAEEILALVHDLDVVVVTSAGNARSDVVYNSPEKLRETITVASSGQDDRPSETFTSFGWLVDVAAPGGGPTDDSNVRIARRNILSLRSAVNVTPEVLWVQDDWFRNSGTSMSSPHVAGAVALLRAHRPELRYESIRRILRQSAVDLGPPGPDRDMGAGRLDVLAALTHPELPDLLAALESPRPGAVFAPLPNQHVDILGTAAGDDLLEFELAFGPGTSPNAFTTIARSTQPVSNGLLARLELSDLEEGSYLLRLVVRGTDGSTFHEFLPLSLERNQFRQISSDGPDAQAPDIGGDLVVWQSRRTASAPIESTSDHNIFATHWKTGAQYAIATDEEEQTLPSIADGAIAWLAGGFGSATTRGCKLELGSGLCPELPISREHRTSLGPASALGRIYWQDSSTGVLDLHGCVPGADDCEPIELGLAPERRSFVRSDGRSLSWVALGNHFGVCDLDPATGACPEQLTQAPILALSRPTYSDGLLAWVSASFNGPGDLYLCELDPDSGSCEPIWIAEAVGDSHPELSGRRLVWDAAVGDEEGDVFFCEYDPALERCPVQRLTAHMSLQDSSRIDGDRVVWRDQRTGPLTIHAASLPSLAPLSDRTVRAGGTLRVLSRPEQPHRRDDPRAISVSAELPDGSGVESLGARFVSHGEKGMLVWRPRADQIGTQLVTFTGRTPSGLATRETIRIEVLPPRKRGPQNGGFAARLQAWLAQKVASFGSRTGRPAR